MLSRSLLKRLESPEPSDSRYLPGDPKEVMDAIRDHLQIMLNSRLGGSESAPKFGTTNFSDFYQGYESIQAFKEQIRQSIERYEPRLSDVQVFFNHDKKDPFQMFFDIMANIVSEDGEVSASFRTAMTGSGEMKIQ